MAEIKTSEQLAQRALDVNVVDDGQLQSVWSELGSTTAPLGDFQQALLRSGLLTQYQLERLMNGYRTGFFYGDYKVLYCVGAGTFARVYRASHKQTGKMYAVKVLRSRYSNPKATDAKTGKSNKPFIELFRREGEIGIQLKHPNIVEIHEIYSHGLTHYLVMEFIEGQNLREFYRARRRFEPLEAAHIMEGVMSGLNYALAAGHHAPRSEDVQRAALERRRTEARRLRPGRRAGRSGRRLDRRHQQRTVDYAGLERAIGRPQGRCAHRHFLLPAASSTKCSAGNPRSAESRDRAQAGKARYTTEIKPILTLVPEAAAAAGDGRRQGDGI